MIFTAFLCTQFFVGQFQVGNEQSFGTSEPGAASSQWYVYADAYGDAGYATWIDHRSEYWRIAGSWLAPDGRPLQPEGVLLGGISAGLPLFSPPAVGDGVALVTWFEQHELGAWELRGSRVGPDGVPLDGEGFLLASLGSYSTKPSPIWTGSGWLVAWAESPNGGDIFGRAVALDGTLGPRMLLFTSPRADDDPNLARGPGFALLSWVHQNPDGGDALWASRIDFDGGLLDSAPLTLAEAPRVSTNIGSTFDGARFVSAWKENSSLYAATTELDGGAGTPRTFVDSMLDPIGPDLCATSNEVVLATVDDDVTVRAYSLDTDGGIQVANSQSVSQYATYHVGLACFSDHAVVATSDWTQSRAFTQTFDPAAGLSSRQRLSAAPGQQSGLRLASNGANFLAAWLTETDGGQRVEAILLNPDGTQASGLIDLPFPTVDDAHPSIATDGTNYLIAAAVITQASPLNTDLKAVRVSFTGALLDSTPFTVSAGAGQQWMSHGLSLGGRYLSIWEDSSVSGNGVDVRGVFTSFSGVVEDAGSFILAGGTNDQSDPHVSTSRSTSLLSWSEGVGAQTNGYVAFLSVDGGVSGAQRVMLDGGSRSPVHAFDGRAYQLVWESPQKTLKGELFHATLSEDGTLSPSERLLPNGEFGQSPEIECAGGACFVVYTSYLDAGVQVRTVQLEQDGGVSAPMDWIGSSDTSVRPVISARGPGEFLFGYLRSHPEAPYMGTTMIGIRTVRDSSQVIDVDAGEPSDGGRERVHLRVGCGCSTESSASIIALLALTLLFRTRRAHRS